MASMHPEILELEYTESEAEIYVYEEMRRQLDDSFHVFHSVTWTGNRNIRGECDFIIFRRQRGFVALEVKGGSIELIENAWYSVGKTNQRVRIKDPVKQARYAQWAFRDLYKTFFNEYFTGVFTWAVCFPEASPARDFHHKDLNSYNVLHAGSMRSIRKWIDELFEYTRPGASEAELPAREAERFLSLFNVSMRLPRSILFALHKQEEELEAINHFQDYLLDLFDDKRRVGFQGPAGTGKTWLAMKKAMRLAEKGQEVLLLCFSNYLEAYLKKNLQNVRNVRVATFHDFAAAVLRDFFSARLRDPALTREFQRLVVRLRRDVRFGHRADDELDVHDALRIISRLPARDYLGLLDMHRREGVLDDELLDIIALLLPHEGCMDPAGYYSCRLPAALLRIFEEYSLREQFDAIIIDEAQDFVDNWCDCITYFFRSSQDRTIYLFYDDNQAIFRGAEELPVVRLLTREDLNDYVFHLQHNLRNSQEIHDFAVKKTGLGSTAHSMDIRGFPPETVEFTEREAARRHVGGLLHELVRVNGLKEKDITVLCNVPIWASVFGAYPEHSGFALNSEGESLRKGEVAFRTISQFKGLESAVVICVLDHQAEVDEEHHRITAELEYIAFTRAKYLLYVVDVR